MKRAEKKKHLVRTAGRLFNKYGYNGVGIDPKNLNKLFQPHFTTKKRGSGLGLAIVNRIIVDHNGTIQIQENHPKGTKILIELPSPSTFENFAPIKNRRSPGGNRP